MGILGLRPEEGTETNKRSIMKKNNTRKIDKYTGIHKDKMELQKVKQCVHGSFWEWVNHELPSPSINLSSLHLKLAVVFPATASRPDMFHLFAALFVNHFFFCNSPTSLNWPLRLGLADERKQWLNATILIQGNKDVLLIVINYFKSGVQG